MPLNIKPSNFKYLILGTGGLGIALRALLYATGLDSKGLLVRGHWAETGLWILTALAVLSIVLLTRSLKVTGSTLPQSVAAGAGCLVASIGVLLSIGFTPRNTLLDMAELTLAGVAAISLAVLAFCRFTGRKPLFLFHCLVCIYLAVRTVGQYRLWSSAPQLQDYCFYLGAHVVLMLTAYQFAAFDVQMNNLRSLWAWGLASVYLCCLALVGEGQIFLPFCFGIWVFSNLIVPHTEQIPAEDPAPDMPRQEEIQ